MLLTLMFATCFTRKIYFVVITWQAKINLGYHCSLIISEVLIVSFRNVFSSQKDHVLMLFWYIIYNGCFFSEKRIRRTMNFFFVFGYGSSGLFFSHYHCNFPIQRQMNSKSTRMFWFLSGDPYSSVIKSSNLDNI